ncbi:hypothetical protein GVAV_001061 [Gurleya vavrai]
MTKFFFKTLCSFIQIYILTVTNKKTQTVEEGLKRLFLIKQNLLKSLLELKDIGIITTKEEAIEKGIIKSSDKNMQIEQKTSKKYSDLKRLYYKIGEYTLRHKKYDICIEYSKKLISIFRYNIIYTMFFDALTRPDCFIFVKNINNYHFENTNIIENDFRNKVNDMDLIIETSNYIKGFYDENLLELKIDQKFFLDVLTIFIEQKKRLNKKTLFAILKNAYKLLSEYDNVCFVDTKNKVYIFGDTHGQFFDTFGAFIGIEGNSFSKKNGLVIDTTKVFIFNGNYVNHGKYSIENYTFLLLLKILYPKNIYLNRGKNEFFCQNVNYGFLNEIHLKYDAESEYRCVYKRIKNNENLIEIYNILNAFCLTFSVLPLATIINKKVFVVHGGLPKETYKINRIQKLDRKTQEIKRSNVLNELLNSNPIDQDNDIKIVGEIGINFGKNNTEKFLYSNDLSIIIRSSELVYNGVKTSQNRAVVTVFSAPRFNYNSYHNYGAYLILKTNEEKGDAMICENLFYNYKQFDECSQENFTNLN